MHEPAQTFATKVDTWVAILLGAALGTMVYGVVQHLAVAASMSEIIRALFSPVLSCILVVLLSVPTRYELHPGELRVRAGILRYRVPYSDIRSIVPSHSPRAAPAWSLRRLKIKRSYGSLLISPKDKEGFLRAVASRAPHLVMVGDRLEPRTASEVAVQV